VDIKSKVEELNQALGNRDKMKDDAIAQLAITSTNDFNI
jgi:hypothetical protein